MPPTTVNEDRIRIFNYYHAGQLWQGMMCQNRLYRLVSSFQLEEQPKAYALSHKLNNSGACTIISHTPEICNVWLDLRTGLAKKAS